MIRRGHIRTRDVAALLFRQLKLQIKDQISNKYCGYCSKSKAKKGLAKQLASEEADSLKAKSSVASTAQRWPADSTAVAP
jgi:hypothetical protein